MMAEWITKCAQCGKQQHFSWFDQAKECARCPSCCPHASMKARHEWHLSGWGVLPGPSYIWVEDRIRAEAAAGGGVGG